MNLFDAIISIEVRRQAREIAESQERNLREREIVALEKIVSAGKQAQP